ncbi:MAG TPA: hypothetical protein VKD91_18465 [Pyrinomonadaceae bacterium]|nr:hypothetical protein [Pyrinomonadaceae bacterium]
MRLSPRTALAAAAIFHIILILSLFGVGRLGWAGEKIDRDGIGEFARDSRPYKIAVAQLADLLKQGQVQSWIHSPEQFHLKVYSLSVLPLGFLFGNNILAVELLNLLYYLTILALVFGLGKLVAGERAAWLAAFIVAFWPSLLLHTTQFLRDPLVLTAFLALFTILTLLLKENLTWRYAAGAAIAGAVSMSVVWHSRREIWPVITAVVLLSALLLLIKIACLRKLFTFNLVVMAALIVLTFMMSRPATGVVGQPQSNAPKVSSFWRRVANVRIGFISEGMNVSGSMIDADVTFNSGTDVIKYVPRALEISYLAPFPLMWFKTGYNVGRLGRLISGLEMTLTYLFEALACFFVWRTKKHFSSWLLVLTTMIGMLALGLVVANVGTLYRMRYPFWVLLVIMGAGALVNLRTAKTSTASA